MKRLSTIIMALVLALGLTQCKKEQPTNEFQGETYTINLSVKGNNGAKVEVNTITGSVYYETGDQIIVANGGKYVGTLTYDGTIFTGAIGNATEGLPLHFYFLGNVTPAETLSIGNTESCSVVISDQTEHLPVISTAPSNENFYGTVTDYTAELLNKCALVKFDVTTSSAAATCLTGFNNKVTVDFGENTLSNSIEGNGIITLPAGNGEKWAILLPQEAMASGIANSEDGAYTGAYNAVPAIYANGYFPAGIAVEVSIAAGGGNVFDGALSGKFTINDDGDQIYFSKGNLQYIGSAGNGDENNTGAYWKFADHQWECFGTSTGQNSSNKQVDRDLFGWGTSGYNHGAVCYQPWSTSTENSHYFAYGIQGAWLSQQTGQADWGYNAIVNGGNQENSGWHTIWHGHMRYIFEQRPNAASKWGHGRVNGVNGVIILPDEWTLPSGLSFFPGSSDWANVYDANQWALMEANGAVFLPAAGSRDGTWVDGYSSYGYYWGCRAYDWDPNWVNTIDFHSAYMHSYSSLDRHKGFAVRLVLSVEPEEPQEPEEPTAPEGALNGLFTVSATRQVNFSQGNLQYIGSAATPYWRFADEQWDYFGTAIGQNSNSQTVDRDLFGWGTSGYNHGAVCYHPWDVVDNASQYYAYGNDSYHLYNQTGQADWGYNAIANGGNQENSGWRTLTRVEWNYLFNIRTDAASKYGHGKVNGVKGMILLPDVWTQPDGLTFTAGNSSWANVYSGDQWIQMEQNGAVFLPTAGFREGTSVSYVGSYGYYWSSSYANDATSYAILFVSGTLIADRDAHRYSGFAVRLVRNAE